MRMSFPGVAEDELMWNADRMAILRPRRKPARGVNFGDSGAFWAPDRQ